jgi:hypothetical protein
MVCILLCVRQTVPPREQYHNIGKTPSHTQRINITHLNSALINTKLHVRDKPFTQQLVIESTRQKLDEGTSVRDSTNNHELSDNIRQFLVLAQLSRLFFRNKLVN